MLHLQARLDDLNTRWVDCKAEADRKCSLISDLFKVINGMSKKLSEADLEIRDKKDVIKLNRDRLDEAQSRIKVLESERARHVFALVLIDGDCMPFHDDLVKLGLEGGQKTSRQLKQAVEEYLKSSLPSTTQHIQVYVRVYANVKGLAKTYKEADILSDVLTFGQFVRGFNMGNALCDFIDAGDQKECSDEKIKTLFRNSLEDTHCQKLFFGGTADSGYARLLGPFTEDEAARKQVILLEGPPMARDLVKLKDVFQAVSLGTIFRNQKLAKREMPTSITPPATPVAGYAIAAAKASNTPTGLSSPQQVPLRSTSSSTPGVLRNKRGQRVDAPLSYSSDDFHRLKNLGLCNKFLILGRCWHTEQYGNCIHDHKARLTQQEKEALRAVARQSACDEGLACDNADCLLGHRCIKNGCPRIKCRFSAQMHGVDTNVVSEN